jgi:hypothetical protein
LLVRPITGHKGPDGGVELLLYAFFNLGARWRWVINPTPRALYPRERAPISIVQEAGWDTGQVWTGAKNLAPTEIRSPDLPSYSKSLLLLLISLLKFKNIFHKDGIFYFGVRYAYTAPHISLLVGALQSVYLF